MSERERFFSPLKKHATCSFDTTKSICKINGELFSLESFQQQQQSQQTAQQGQDHKMNQQQPSQPQYAGHPSYQQMIPRGGQQPRMPSGQGTRMGNNIVNRQPQTHQPAVPQTPMLQHVYALPYAYTNNSNTNAFYANPKHVSVRSDIFAIKMPLRYFEIEIRMDKVHVKMINFFLLFPLF